MLFLASPFTSPRRKPSFRGEDGGKKITLTVALNRHSCSPRRWCGLTPCQFWVPHCKKNSKLLESNIRKCPEGCKDGGKGLEGKPQQAWLRSLFLFSLEESEERLIAVYSCLKRRSGATDTDLFPPPTVTGPERIA